jgi:hypothetical protein
MSLLTEIFGLLDCWNADRRKSGPAARDENLSGMPSDGMFLSASPWNIRSRPLDQTYKQDIRKLLLSELNRQSWSNLKAADIVVEQDAIWLYGIVRDEEEKRTIIMAARQLPGVRRVESRLAFCVQPFL